MRYVRHLEKHSIVPLTFNLQTREMRVFCFASKLLYLCIKGPR